MNAHESRAIAKLESGARPAKGKMLRELALLREEGGIKGLAVAHLPAETFDDAAVDEVVRDLLAEIRAFVLRKGESGSQVGIIIPTGVLVGEGMGGLGVEEDEEAIELAWMPGPRRAFARLCEGLEGGVVEMMKDLEGTGGGGGRGGKSGVNLILWPFAHQGIEEAEPLAGRDGGAISDVPSIQTFFRERSGSDAGQGGMLWKLLFDPAWLLTPSMRVNAMDHLQRMFAVCGTHPMAWGVVLDRGLEWGLLKGQTSWQGPSASVAAMFENCGLLRLERV